MESSVLYLLSKNFGVIFILVDFYVGEVLRPFAVLLIYR